MWNKIRTVWQIPELRQKILLTLLMLAIYRIGFMISLPVVDQAAVELNKSSPSGVAKMLEMVAVLSASQLTSVTIFGLGIMPYITASIIFQLLGSVVPALENLKKEGAAGQKKITEWTRYATVGICLIQSWMYVNMYVEAQGFAAGEFCVDGLGGPGGQLLLSWKIYSVITMTCGTVFLMWLGEQIDEFGIGNGISLLIMGGILAKMPSAGIEILNKATRELGAGGGQFGPEKLIMLAVIFVAVVVGVVFITLGQRRIPMQSAKHVRGSKSFGGNRQYLPLRVNQAGVMPIIFASSLMMFPMVIATQLANVFPEGILGAIASFLKEAMSYGSYLHSVISLAMIYFFCYFWTTIQFNPKEMADNLKNYGSFIPGHRPGKRTADYLEKVMLRITYVGAAFLAIVAIIPTIVSTWMGVPMQAATFYGGTSLLIAVSVAFDLVQKIDSHLVMRNHKGLLEK